MNTPCTYQNFLLELDRTRNREIYAKVIALTLDESPIQSIEGRLTGGSINVDGNSAVRRTCSLTMVAQDFEYNDYLWGLNTKFKLEVGVKNNINSNFPDIVWFKQGIFVLTSFNVSQQASSFTINLSGKDKMCLLNGENGGTLESSIDFGTIQEEDDDGRWVITKIPIPEIIRNAVHVYGREPYHNIIINDLDIYGRELLEYRYDTPMYLYRLKDSKIYDNVRMEDSDFYVYLDVNEASSKRKLSEIPSDYLEALVTTLTDIGGGKPVYLELGNSDSACYFTKISYGDTAGYRATDLTYAGDLISKVGESLTSVLDKIKNMLSEYEYFYNLEGQFVFQKKQSFISTMWTVVKENEEEQKKQSLSQQIASTVDYLFAGTDLITAVNINPNIANVKNDFSIWGERVGTSGVKIPIHMRYSINKKPIYYKSYDGNEIYITKPEILNKLGITTTNEAVYCVDWREIIYQMSKDYYQHNTEENFEMIIEQNNNKLYPGGRTGYESYYIDLQSFWRELYYPDLDDELGDILNKWAAQKTEMEKLYNFLYGDEVEWSENRVGGLENDINLLSQLLVDNKIDVAESLIKYWNTKERDDILKIDVSSNFTAPKYDFKIDNGSLIEDIDLFLTSMQDTYFRNQSSYNSGKVKLDDLTSKKDKLEEYKKDNYYDDDDTKIQDRWYWNKNVYENPNLLNFWFDFLDEDESSFGQYSTSNLGNRPKAIQDTNVKSIYYRETPEVVFKKASEDIKEIPGYRVIQVNSIDSMFTISAQGKSAKEKLDELLYQHTCVTETATITTVPIYYLQPNHRIKIFNVDKLNGDYIINRITIPLTYNGTMSLQITKAIDNTIGVGTN